MVSNQFSKLLLLFFLFGCSNENTESNIDYSKEFDSIIKEFNQSSILEFNKSNYLNDAFISEFLEKLDPQKTVFIQDDINEIMNTEVSTNEYLIFRKSVEKFYQRFNESISYRMKLLKSYSFDLNKDEYIFLNSRDSYFINKDEKNDYQRKYLKNEIIAQMLEEKSYEEAIKELSQSYSDRASSLKKLRESDKFGLLANNFLSLFDPHSSYFSRRDLENWNLRMNLSFEGIGAILSYENEKAKIEELMPGGPAINSQKIKVGDKIIKVGEGKQGKLINVIGWRLDDIVERIRGEEGTIIKLEIENEDGRNIIELERGKVSLEESDASKEILEFDGKKLGYIKVPSFYSDAKCFELNNYACKSATNDVQKFLRDFRFEGIEGLIIDLRNNGGGYLHEADSLTRLFINYGPTVQIKSPDKEVVIYNSWKSNRSWNKPLIVLVNKFSASASEIFAGAMQDYNRAIIVGQTTFGKGSVQRFTETENGQIKITDSLYYRVTGKPTQIFGVKPNLEIPSLINSDGLGEDRYENAIKPSQIENSWYYSYDEFNMDKYLANHEKRLAESEYFTKMDELKNYRNSKKESLSLKISERKLNYEDNKKRNLKLINLGREISGDDIFENYEQYLEREINDDFVLDAEIDQSLKILIDLIEIES
ncbi:MAG: hypothetical protein CMD63_00915 [Gammaproteobacteria bacterium]|nr:hypothetical protein [Gammaproteobacteria bacterium]